MGWIFGFLAAALAGLFLLSAAVFGAVLFLFFRILWWVSWPVRWCLRDDAARDLRMRQGDIEVEIIPPRRNG